jgi:hypothetical protein
MVDRTPSGEDTTIDQADRFLARLAAVRQRLAEHAASIEAHAGLTEADARTGERWDQGQVWAHLAEFQAYWLGQLGAVVAGSSGGAGASDDGGSSGERGGSGTGAAVAFGRTVADARRAEIIERDRHLSVAHLQASVDAQAEATAAFLRGLDRAGWQARGLHPSLGVMAMPAMVERFLIGHLEEHAAQLDGLRPSG